MDRRCCLQRERSERPANRRLPGAASRRRLRLSYRNVMESRLAEFTTENRIEVGAIDNYITSVTPTDGHPRKEFDEGSHRPLPSGSVRPPRAQSHHSTLRGSVANNDVESHPIMELTAVYPHSTEEIRFAHGSSSCRVRFRAEGIVC